MIEVLKKCLEDLPAIQKKKKKLKPIRKVATILITYEENLNSGNDILQIKNEIRKIPGVVEMREV